MINKADDGDKISANFFGVRKFIMLALLMLIILDVNAAYSLTMGRSATGEVVQIDADKMQISIKTDKEFITSFSMNYGTKYYDAYYDEPLSVSDIKVGQKIRIDYNIKLWISGKVVDLDRTEKRITVKPVKRDKALTTISIDGQTTFENKWSHTPLLFQDIKVGDHIAVYQGFTATVVKVYTGQGPQNVEINRIWEFKKKGAGVNWIAIYNVHFNMRKHPDIVDGVVYGMQFSSPNKDKFEWMRVHGQIFCGMPTWERNRSNGHVLDRIDICYDEKRQAYETMAPHFPERWGFYWYEIMPVSDDFVDDLICENLLKKIKKGDFKDSRQIKKD
jgi:hypothetical protein